MKNWVEQWKKERGKAAENLPRDYFAYGLGIGMRIPKNIQNKIKTSGYKKSSVFSKTGLAGIISFDEICKKKKLKNISQNLFNRASLSLDKNFYYASAAANISSVDSVISDGISDEITIKNFVSGKISDVLIIIAQNNSKLFIDDIITGKDTNALAARLVFCFADKGSRIVYTSKTSNNLNSFGCLIGVAGKNSSIVCVDKNKSSFAQYNRRVVLSDEGASFKSALFLQVKNGLHDYSYEAIHEASHTDSLIRAAGTLLRGNIIFRALTKASSDIIKSKGNQTARFMTLSKEAEIDAIPSLEIASGDMETSHSVSVSYFDDTSLWYPGSRGISKDAAQSLLSDGLFSTLKKFVSA